MEVLLVTWRLAWRNLWRSRRRTLLTAGGLALGLVMILFQVALTNGMTDRIVETVTRMWMGEAQVFAEGYWRAPDVARTLGGAEARLEALRARPEVQGATARLIGPGVLAVGDRSQPVELVGVDFEAEGALFRLPERLKSGVWPAAGARRAVVLGHTLAEKLEVEVGSPLVITTARVGDGDISSARLQVSAILATGDLALDAGRALIDIEQVSALLALPDQAHTIALRLSPTHSSALEGLKVAAGDGAAIEPWTALAPGMAKIGDWQGLTLMVLLSVVGFILAMATLNTLSMALVERMREFGILRALGTRPLRLAGLILMEALALGVVGVVAGLALYTPLHLWGMSSGVPTPGAEIAGVSISEPIRLRLDLEVALVAAGVLVVITVLVSLFAAWRAARVSPIEALRRPT